MRRKRKKYQRTLANQILACILIVLFVIVIKRMDLAIVNSTAEVIKTTFLQNYSISYLSETAKIAIDKAASVPAWITSALSGGEKEFAFSPPADSVQAFSTFGPQNGIATSDESGFQRGMYFYGDQEIQVHAIGGGTVTEIGQSSQYGRYIKLSHGNKAVSIYGGCTDVYVKELEKVKRGQLIATVDPADQNYLRFELWINGEIVNPADYIEF